MADITGAELVVDSLRREGIDTVYTLPGDPVGPIVNGLCRGRSARYFGTTRASGGQWPRRLTPTSLVVSESA